jgi:hypothetical protein
LQGRLVPCGAEQHRRSCPRAGWRAAIAIATAMSSPPSSWPRREFRVAVNAAIATLDSSTTTTSSSSTPGIATGTGATLPPGGGDHHGRERDQGDHRRDPHEGRAEQPGGQAARRDRQQREPFGS